jgi:hypothetical protein
VVVLFVNLLMRLVERPRMYTGFPAEPRFGETTLSAMSGAWSAVTALAIVSLLLALIPTSACPS